MARKKPLPENERCRGRWSKCGGANPAKSAKWHLCDNGPDSCTAKYRAMKKAEAAKAAKAKPAAKPATKPAATPRSRSTRSKGGQPRTKRPPTPEMHTGVPVARVNAPEQASHMVMLVTG